jgi:hypothetical protein
MLPDSDFGSLKTTFGPNRANARIILYVMPVFILVGLILIARILVGGVTMLLIAGGLYLGYRAQMRARVDVHDKGVTAVDWLGRKFLFRWDELTAVYEFVGYEMRPGMRFGRPIQWKYTVVTRDGRSIKLDMGYERIQNLGHVLLEETGKLLLPVARETLRTGGTVSFGEQIALNKAGFVSEGKKLDWADVEKIRFTGTADITIHMKGQHIPWKLVMHSRIANFPVFQVLLHEVIKATPAEALLEDPSFERFRQEGDKPVANIGTLSAAIGYDVRDLLMEGFTMPEIQQVARGEITLEQLCKLGPRSKK